MLLQKLFHEFPQTDPIVPKSSSGLPFPAFLDEEGRDDLLSVPPGHTPLPVPLPSSALPAHFISEVFDPPEDLPMLPPSLSPHPDFEVTHPSLPKSAYGTIKDLIDLESSSGYFTGGVLSSHGDGTVDYTAIEGLIKVSDSLTAATVFFHIDAGNIGGLTDQVVNYIFVDYNGGSPTVNSTTDRSTIKLTDQFTIGRIFRNGTFCDVAQAGNLKTNQLRNEYERLISKGLMERESGCALGSTGIQLTTTAGVFYMGLTRLNTNAWVAGTNFEHYYYRNGSGGWTDAPATPNIDNTRYDNGSGTLATLTNNRYGVHWVYVDPTGNLSIIYGTGDYNSLAAASASSPPGTVPPYISGFTILVGRAIIQKSAATIAQVDSAFVTLFVPQAVTDHNSLSGLQGGALNEYYHLTGNQANLISGGIPAHFLDETIGLYEDLPMLPPGTSGSVTKGDKGDPGPQGSTGVTMIIEPPEPPEEPTIFPSPSTPLTVLPFFLSGGAKQNVAFNNAGNLPFFIASGTEEDIPATTANPLPQALGTGDSPTHVDITLSGLTASKNVVTDAGKVLVSGDQRTNTGDSPTFAGMTLSGLTNGLITVASGVLSGNVKGIKYGTATYDVSTAPGATLVITGVGFTPTVVFFWVTMTGAQISIGIDDTSANSARVMGVFVPNVSFTANSVERNAGDSINIGPSSGKYIYGHITATSSDGFTITFVKVSTPTGTATISYLAIKA